MVCAYLVGETGNGEQMKLAGLSIIVLRTVFFEAGKVTTNSKNSFFKKKINKKEFHQKKL